MRVTIDNLDGKGPVDYSGAVCWEKKLSIDRKLNVPATCAFLLDLESIAMPLRDGRVRVIADNATVVFTGYIAREPAQEYAGAGIAGAAYRVLVDAVSDEFAMDRVPLTQQSAVHGQTIATVLRDLTQLAPGGADASSVASAVVVGSYAGGAEQSWSAQAGTLGSMTRNAYRVIDGTVSLTTAGSVVHTLSDGDGTLNAANLSVQAVRELVNDVTLSGPAEPATYVTELFQGDGRALIFELTRTPYAVQHKTILDDAFVDATTFNQSVWRVSDPGSRLTLTGSGVAVSGGNGVDGATTLAAAHPLEIGGEVVLEAGGVQLNAGSEGYLCAAYAGVTAEANCFVGFRVRPNNGATAIVAVVDGVEQGSPFATVVGHTYRLRIRVHAPELYRTAQTYYVDAGAGIEQYGGELTASPVNVLFEIEDSAAAANALSTVLYDGVLLNSPPLCSFVALNSTNLLGSFGYFRVTQPGTTWVTSQKGRGLNTFTRRIGLASVGSDCQIEKGGKMRFYKVSAPAVGEMVSVTYRTAQASIARLAAPTAGAAGWWAGKVERPAARSSEDCENAAAAVLTFSADPAAALQGTYAMTNPQQATDVWPGDALVISLTGLTRRLIVRAVKIDVDASSPELATYHIAFANDWAEALSVKLAAGLASGAQAPIAAATAPVQVAANLPRLVVTGWAAASLAVNANATAEAGGGFEVRRRDGNFGPGAQQDLVLRSPTQDFTLARAGEKEQFFVRMYDGSVPPKYSRFSSAIFIDAPMT